MALSVRQHFLNDVARERGEPRCDLCCEPTDNLPDDDEQIICDNCCVTNAYVSDNGQFGVGA